MNKYLSNILAITLAAFFIIGGSGLNIVKYCCNICSEHGIEEVAEKSCSAFHHHEDKCCESETSHNEDANEDMICSNTGHNPHGCHILRLKVETPTILINNILDISATKYIALFHLTLIPENTNNLSFVFQRISHSPPNLTSLTGREILTNKSVLII